MKSSHLVAIVALASLAFATSSFATDLYNNIGLSSHGFDVINPPIGPLYDSFSTPGSRQTITGLTLKLEGSNQDGTLTVGLYADSSTTPGGLISALGTFDDSTIGSTVADYAVTLPINPPTLAAGTRYWIGLTDTKNGGVSWSFPAYSSTPSGTGVVGEYFTVEGKTYSNSKSSPFQMDLTSVAAPDGGSTAMLLGMALLGLVLLRRKLRPCATG